MSNYYGYLLPQLVSVYNSYQTSFKSTQIKEQGLKNDFCVTWKQEIPEMWTTQLTQNQISFYKSDEKIRTILIESQLKIKILHFDKKNIKSPVIGFCLKNVKNDLEILFNSENRQVIKKWVDYLSSKINRLGFKEYFKPIQKLGKGGNANVFQVQSLLDGKRYAVKAYSKSYINQSTRVLKSFQNELKILRTIDHKNCQKLLGVFESDNTIYIQLQLLKGGTLMQRVMNKNASLCLSDQQIKKIAKGTLNGLKYLELMGIVHRDIKLENIMLKDLVSCQPIIVDFGFSIIKDRLFQNDTQSIAFPYCGTPGYMAPQIFNTQGNIYQLITPKLDIFALGVCLYILTTKKPLFQGKQLKQVLQNNKKFQYALDLCLEPKVKNLIKKMIQKDHLMRLNASQALNHEYFQEYEENTIGLTKNMKIQGIDRENEGKQQIKTQQNYEQDQYYLQMN